MSQAILIIIAAVVSSNGNVLGGAAITQYSYNSMRQCQDAAAFANASSSRDFKVSAFCIPRS